MVSRINEAEWLVSIPEGKTFTAALTSACKGNDRLANLLNYFLFEASREAKRLGIDRSQVEYIEIKRTLDQIVTGLAKYNKPASKKTVHDRIVNLTSLLYLQSDGYHSTYRVMFKIVEKAFINPPEQEKPKLRGRHVHKLASNEQLEETEESKLELKVKSTILAQKVAILEEQKSNLTSQMSNLTSQMLDLTSLISQQEARIAELEAKISPRYSIDTVIDTNIDTNVSRQNGTPTNITEISKKRTRTTTPKDTKSAITLTSEEQVIHDLYSQMWFIEVPLKITDTFKAHCHTLAGKIHTLEEMKSLEAQTRKDLKKRGITDKFIPLGSFVNSINNWNRPGTITNELPGMNGHTPDNRPSPTVSELQNKKNQLRAAKVSKEKQIERGELDIAKQTENRIALLEAEIARLSPSSQVAS